MVRPDIIVMGASAGGIEALQTLVFGLPANLPASVFVVVHTAPEDGHLAEILNRNGNIRAVKALNGLPILRKHIYVAPPNQHLLLERDRMWLTVGPKVNRNRPAIDPLFESAAKAFGPRVVGVVLSGYLDDGSVGLSVIKQHGGTTIVQDPAEAFAPNMPRSALRATKVDYCVNLEEIAPLLVRLVNGRKEEGKNRKNNRK